MKLVEINWEPTDRQLRQFGTAALIVLPLAAWWWGGASSCVFWTGATAGGAAALLAILRPASLKAVFLGLSLLSMPIGMVMAELAMLLVYGIAVLPIGLFFRLVGRDPLQRGLDRSAATYWEPRKPPSGPASYLRQW